MAKFRYAFVTDPAHDVSAILPFVDKILFALTGYEKYEEMSETAAHNLVEFSPSLDVIVPVGGLVATFIVARVIAIYALGQPVTVAIYKDKSYEFLTVGK